MYTFFTFLSAIGLTHEKTIQFGRKSRVLSPLRERGGLSTIGL